MGKYNTITPWITTKDTRKLIDFLVSSFDAVELGCVKNSNGSIGHAEVQIGDSKIMMFDTPNDIQPLPSLINLFVEDSERLYNQVLKAGAVSMTKITKHSWGDKSGRIIDPFGNVWWIVSCVEDVSAEEMQKRFMQKEYQDAMEYAQSSFDLKKAIEIANKE